MDKQHLISIYYKLELPLVFLILSMAFFATAATTPIHVDEPSWIAQSYYLEEWLHLDSNKKMREVNDLNLGDPNLTKFLVGIGRNISGITIDQLNQQYDYSISFNENKNNGNVPSK